LILFLPLFAPNVTRHPGDHDNTVTLVMRYRRK
jgi:hypothetical protein